MKKLVSLLLVVAMVLAMTACGGKEKVTAKIIEVDLTEEQYGILQSLVDEAYDQFVEIICTGRGMKEETVRTLGDGRIYSAKQALEHKLIDAIGSMDDAKAALVKDKKVAKDILYYAPEDDGTFMSALYGAVQGLKPRSEMELATDIMENNGNGVLKYYAN